MITKFMQIYQNQLIFILSILCLQNFIPNSGYAKKYSDNTDHLQSKGYSCKYIIKYELIEEEKSLKAIPTDLTEPVSGNYPSKPCFDKIEVDSFKVQIKQDIIDRDKVYQFEGWVLDGCSSPDITVDNNKPTSIRLIGTTHSTCTITAQFSYKEYDIHVTSIPSGTPLPSIESIIDPDGTTKTCTSSPCKVKATGSVKFTVGDTANPNLNWIWNTKSQCPAASEGAGCSQKSASCTMTNIKGNCTVTVNYQIYAVAVGAAGKVDDPKTSRPIIYENSNITDTTGQWSELTISNAQYAQFNDVSCTDDAAICAAVGWKASTAPLTPHPIESMRKQPFIYVKSSGIWRNIEILEGGFDIFYGVFNKVKCQKNKNEDQTVCIAVGVKYDSDGFEWPLIYQSTGDPGDQRWKNSLATTNNSPLTDQDFGNLSDIDCLKTTENWQCVAIGQFHTGYYDCSVEKQFPLILYTSLKSAAAPELAIWKKYSEQNVPAKYKANGVSCFDSGTTNSECYIAMTPLSSSDSDTPQALYFQFSDSSPSSSLTKFSNVKTFLGLDCSRIGTNCYGLFEDSSSYQKFSKLNENFPQSITVLNPNYLLYKLNCFASSDLICVAIGHDNVNDRPLIYKYVSSDSSNVWTYSISDWVLQKGQLTSLHCIDNNTCVAVGYVGSSDDPTKHYLRIFQNNNVKTSVAWSDGKGIVDVQGEFLSISGASND